MHKPIRLFVAVACITVAACNDAPTEPSRKDGFGDNPVSKEDSLHHDVMEGHDVGMAKIGRLRRYIGQIQQQEDSIGKLPAGKQDKQYLQALSGLKADLATADKGMNTWMEEYNNDSAKGNEPLRLQYLESEKAKVTLVKDQILSAMNRADSLLKKP